MGTIIDRFQSRDLILIRRPIGAHPLPACEHMTTSCVYDKKKKVLCAIFGCGTRSGRDKGIKRTSVQNQTKMKFLWQGSKTQIVSIFAHK